MTIHSEIVEYTHQHAGLYDMNVRRKAFLMRNSPQVFRQRMMYEDTSTFPVYRNGCDKVLYVIEPHPDDHDILVKIMTELCANPYPVLFVQPGSNQ
jgi:hypothetical protein